MIRRALPWLLVVVASIAFISSSVPDAVFSADHDAARKRRLGRAIGDLGIDRAAAVAIASDPFNRPILQGIEAAARGHGFRLSIEFVGPNDEPHA